MAAYNTRLPWQDGVSERSIRTILARARSVLLVPNLLRKFWADVLETVVNITNNTPTSTVLYNANIWPSDGKNIVPSPDNVPFSALVNAPPEASHFRALGSIAYAHQHAPDESLTSSHPEEKNIVWLVIRALTFIACRTPSQIHS